MGVSNLYSVYAKNSKVKSPPKNVGSPFIDLNAIIHDIAAIVTGGKVKKVTAKQAYRGAAPEKDREIIDAVLAKIAELKDKFKPTDVFYIAVDGLPPMAKIIHQTAGRAKGTGSRNGFDTVAISPGTDFMFKLNNKIADNVRNRVYSSGDCKVYFSSHTQPGEGEHKISKYMNSVPSTGPIIIVSPDADMYFISLISKSENIYVYKENTKTIKVGSGRSAYYENVVEEVCISIEDLKSKIHHNRYADMTLLGTLLGNDFIPPCTSMMDTKETIERIERAIEISDQIVQIYEGEDGEREFTVDSYNFYIALTVVVGKGSPEMREFKEELEETIEEVNSQIGKVERKAARKGKEPDTKELKSELKRLKRQVKKIGKFLDEPKEGEMMRIARRNLDPKAVPFRGLKKLPEDLLEEKISDAEANKFYSRWYGGELLNLNDSILQLVDNIIDIKDKTFSITPDQLSVMVHQYVLGMYWTLRYYITAGDVDELWYYGYARGVFGGDILDAMYKFMNFDHRVGLPNKGTEMSILHQLCFIIPEASESIMPSELREQVFGEKSYLRYYKKIKLREESDGRDKSNKYMDKSYTYKHKPVPPPLEIVHAIVSSLPDYVIKRYLPTGVVKPSAKAASRVNLDNAVVKIPKRKGIIKRKKVIGKEELIDKNFVPINKEARISNVSMTKKGAKRLQVNDKLKYIRKEEKKAEALEHRVKSRKGKSEPVVEESESDSEEVKPTKTIKRKTTKTKKSKPVVEESSEESDEPDEPDVVEIELSEESDELDEPDVVEIELSEESEDVKPTKKSKPVVEESDESDEPVIEESSEESDLLNLDALEEETDSSE